MKKLRSNYYTVLLMRIVLLYLLWALCRAVFYFVNRDFIGAIPAGEIWSILKASVIFDSASIFYINIPFVFFTLFPFRFRERSGYQKFLFWLFVAVNSFGILVNIGDIYYFEFKLSRVASDDWHFLGESNFFALAWSFMVDYWQGLLFWFLCIGLIVCGFYWTRFIPAKNPSRLRQPFFGFSQILLTAGCVLFMIFGIRGFTLSRASFPISMSDASLFVKPRYASLVLSNPFCLIRTSGQKVTMPAYVEVDDLDELAPVIHISPRNRSVNLPEGTNVMVIIMESFGSAHIAAISDVLAEEGRTYTPFLDSLAAKSFLCTNAFQNGLRSIDALPAIWASIPSFKTQFLSLPNSVAPLKPLPAILAERGYSTMFLHGAVRESMSFVAFGQMAGVRHFVSREDYEAVHGRGDFDGKWGIFDHKFLPFAVDKISELEEPFFSTLFTLSSHHPYIVPSDHSDRFEEGKVPIQRVISYSDSALRDFFAYAEKQPWFDNTLFILTGDHGSGADNEKWLAMPYAYSVPILYYYPGGKLSQENPIDLRGRYASTTQHIDIMPTVLGMLGYDEPYFAFGRDIFNDRSRNFAVNYYGSAFNYMTDSLRYVFNEREVVSRYNYIDDPAGENKPFELTEDDERNILAMKAFIQQYYLRLRERDFLPETE